MKGLVTVIAASLVLVGSQASMADGGHGALKSGWSEPQVSAFVSGCVAAVVIPAKRDYGIRAAQAGKSADDFPEAALRESIGPTCGCVARRIAESWTFDEFMKNAQALSQPILEEAMSGGRCKPEGLLGELLAHPGKK